MFLLFVVFLNETSRTLRRALSPQSLSEPCHRRWPRDVIACIRSRDGRCSLTAERIHHACGCTSHDWLCCHRDKRVVQGQELNRSETTNLWFCNKTHILIDFILYASSGGTHFTPCDQLLCDLLFWYIWDDPDLFMRKSPCCCWVCAQLLSHRAEVKWTMNLPHLVVTFSSSISHLQAVSSRSSCYSGLCLLKRSSSIFPLLNVDRHTPTSSGFWPKVQHCLLL